MAVAAALMCGAASLSSAAPAGAATTRATSESAPSTPGRVCTSARCAPGHAPGATAPVISQLALGAVVVVAASMGAVVRRRRRVAPSRMASGFPSLHFRPPIFA